ncbi:unnamed protein product [Merluccius merluccius]
MVDQGRRKAPVRHWLTLMSGFLENLCFSGLVFVWASLVFVLKHEGYFADHCVNVTLNDNTTATVPSFQSCVLSLFFLWHLLWPATLLFCHFLFLVTFNPTLNRLAGNDLDQGESMQATDLSTFPLSLGLTSLQGSLFCICFTVPVLPLQYVTFVLQVINNTFLYGGHQSFISHVFPECHFGKLSGLIMSISAVALLLQIPAVQFINQALQGDPFYMSRKQEVSLQFELLYLE